MSKKRQQSKKSKVQKAQRTSVIRLSDLGRPFYFLWAGETIALLGAALLEFALGVWAYQKTGSVLEFSGVIVAALLPALLVMPFAGILVDRFDRRYVIISADLLTASLTLLLTLLMWQDQEQFEINKLYWFNSIVSIIGAFRLPAYEASLSRLLPKEKYTRASGLIGMSANLLTMFAPMLAGLIMALAGLSAIIMLDLIAFCLGSFLVIKAFFYAQLDPQPSNNELIPVSHDLLSGFNYLRQQPLLSGLLIYCILQQGLVIFVSTMITPLALATYSEAQLGFILSCGSVGGLFGSLLLMRWHSLKRLMLGVLIADVFLAFAIMLAGTNTSFFLYCSCAFVALFAAGFAEGCSQSLWMRKVPNNYQGRIFAIVESLSLAMCTFITLLGGVAADQYLEPALADGGTLQHSVGALIGTGKGRGIGLLFIVCGCVGLLMSLTALLTRLRHLDEIVKDK